MIAALIPVLGTVLDKILPDAGEREKAKAELARMDKEGELKEMETQMSAIVMEAQSEDPWTSRARPSFLYVVYIIILAAIPMGVLHAIDPALAGDIAKGFKLWLDAIPEDMWTLFGIGYLGYSGARSWDKRTKRMK